MSAERWLERRERFGVRLGLQRMRALCARLGHPERAFAAVHVVGTNGKSTAARTIEAVLADERLRVGAYTSPHVTGWSERIRVLGREADLDGLVERIGPAVGATEEVLGEPVTQFEALTAAAFVAFSDARVDAAAVEAGLGGRFDATNVVDAPVVVLTNVGLDHREQLGPTRDAIAAEKLAVVRPGATVVLGEAEWEGLALAMGAAAVVHVRGDALPLARAAVEALLGRPPSSALTSPVALPGRLETVGESPRELWDGAHNAEGAQWLAERLEAGPWVLVASILADKDVEAILATLAAAAPLLVATRSSNPRALPARELAARARRLGRFAEIEVIEDPAAALGAARTLAVDRGWSVLVAGSLYLLADLVAVCAEGVP